VCYHLIHLARVGIPCWDDWEEWTPHDSWLTFIPQGSQGGRTDKQRSTPSRNVPSPWRRQGRKSPNTRPSRPCRAPRYITALGTTNRAGNSSLFPEYHQYVTKDLPAGCSDGEMRRESASFSHRPTKSTRRKNSHAHVINSRACVRAKTTNPPAETAPHRVNQRTSSRRAARSEPMSILPAPSSMLAIFIGGLPCIGLGMRFVCSSRESK
jgi:hypothetical protein